MTERRWSALSGLQTEEASPTSRHRKGLRDALGPTELWAAGSRAGKTCSFQGKTVSRTPARALSLWAATAGNETEPPSRLPTSPHPAPVTRVASGLLPAPHRFGLCSLPGAPTDLGTCLALGPPGQGAGGLQRAQASV